MSQSAHRHSSQILPSLQQRTYFCKHSSSSSLYGFHFFLKVLAILNMQRCTCNFAWISSLVFIILLLWVNVLLQVDLLRISHNEVLILQLCYVLNFNSRQWFSWLERFDFIIWLHPLWTAELVHNKAMSLFLFRNLFLWIQAHYSRHCKMQNKKALFYLSITQQMDTKREGIWVGKIDEYDKQWS